MNTSSDGHRPDCAKCSALGRKRFAEDNPVRHRCNIMGSGVINRTINDIDKPSNKTYKDNNIVSEIGTTGKEVSDFLYSMFYDKILSLIEQGEIPSLDRIDSNKNYTEDNIRIISFRENSLDGLRNAVKATSKKMIWVTPNHEIIEYSSVSEASRDIGIKRDTIISSRDRGVPTSNGYSFYYESGELSIEEKLQGEIKYQLVIMSNTIQKKIKKGHYTDIGSTPAQIREYISNNFYKDMAEMIMNGVTPSLDLYVTEKGFRIGNMFMSTQEETRQKSLMGR